jgi:hypothetical protein
VSVAIEGNVRVGFYGSKTTIEVQVPLEERSGASKMDVLVQNACDNCNFGFIVGYVHQPLRKVSVLHVKFFNSKFICDA